MSKLLLYLRSAPFALIVAIISMLVQTPHSFTAFYNTSAIRGSWGIAQALTFAIVIDLAILFYTLRRRQDIAVLAAVVMFVINAYYYYSAWGISWSFAFGCFLAAIIPVSVYYYSEEIDEEKVDDQADRYRAQIENLEDIIRRGKAENKKFLETIHEVEDKHRGALVRVRDLEGDNRVKGEQIDKLNRALHDEREQRKRIQIAPLPAGEPVLNHEQTRKIISTGGTSSEEIDPDKNL
jgi:hypothetical protein